MTYWKSPNIYWKKLPCGITNAYIYLEAVEAINSYSWPGNVRELENIIERAAIMSDHAAIDPATLEIDIESSHLNDADSNTGQRPHIGSYADLYQPSQQSHSTNRDSRPDPNVKTYP